MKVTVCDISSALAEAWPCDDAGVSVVTGSVLDVDCDAVVSPANSFGFMDGGVDYAYSAYFGWQVQGWLQAQLRLRPFGELLVGEALLVPTGHDRIPFVISAPTMRVPKRIDDPADVFLATRAAVNCAKNAGLGHIAIPGMGTGCGAIPHDVAANAMRKGILAAFHHSGTPPASWQDAQRVHFEFGK